MRPRARVAVALAAVLGLGAAVAVGAEVLAQGEPAWYPADELVRSLRPGLRARAAREAGVHDLSELPLYDLEVALDEDLERLEVDEQLWITNRWGRSLDTVVLRVWANATAEQPPIRLQGGQCEPLRCEVSNEGAGVIVVRPSQPLGPGERLRVRLRLEGELPRIDGFRASMLGQAVEGIGRLGDDGGGGYGLFARGEEVASLAQFYAVVAPWRDGGFDRGEASARGDLGPSALSHVRLKVTLPEGAQVVTSGRRISERGLGDGRREVRAVAALVRNFALLASERFVRSERQVRGVRVRSWYLPEGRQAGERVLETASSALALFDRRFGRYPYAELDVVQAPLVGGAGGVEYSGLVAVASMLYASPQQSKQGPLGELGRMLGAGSAGGEAADAMRELVTAHEVAHQWWHGLVGSDARRHPFADESLAQYSAILWVEHAHGAERAREEMQRQVVSNYHLMRLMGRPDGAVDRPVDAFGSDLEYAGLVYGKGAVLYRELRALLGDRAFFAGLRRYAERYAFDTAPGRGPMPELARGPKADEVRALARRWLDETHGDEDLGEPSARALISGWADPEMVEQLGPLMDRVLPMLGGGSTQAPSDAELQRSVREMMRMLEGM